jgi:inner membrane protein
VGDLIQSSLVTPFWAWAALAAVILVAELLSGSGWLLWPSASAAAMAFLSLAVRLQGAVAVGVFAALTILTTLLGRRIWRRVQTDYGADINDNIARLVGHRGRAASAFQGRTGRVFIDGKEWAAELDDGEALEIGALVHVTGVDGSRLRVRPARIDGLEV